MRIKQILLIALVLSTNCLLAQGWKRTFGGNAVDNCEAVVRAADDGFFLVGYTQSFGEDGDFDVYVTRLDLNGNVLWTNFYDEGFEEKAFDALLLEDGSLVIAGTYQESPTSDIDGYLLKINAFGEMLWSQAYGGDAEDTFRSIAEGNDGSFVLAGRSQEETSDKNDMYVVKTDRDGVLIWEGKFGSSNQTEEAADLVAVEGGYVVAGFTDTESRTVREDVYVAGVSEEGDFEWSRSFGRAGFQSAKAIVTAADGNLLIGGNANCSVCDFYLIKITSDGTEIWQKVFETPEEEAFGGMTVDPDGAILMSGGVAVGTTDLDLYLLKLNGAGEQIWNQRYGDQESAELGAGVLSTSDGGYVLTGNAGLADLPDFILVKTDAQGNIYSNRMTGKVFYDVNQDNVWSEGDIPLVDWPVEVRSLSDGSDDLFLTVSDENGDYSITVGEGTYRVGSFNQNQDYWSTDTPNYTRVFTTTYDTIQNLDFAYQAKVLCPYINVNISAPSLNACSEVIYTVSVCNEGSSVSDDFPVEVEFDELITIDDASIPYTMVSDNLYRFDLSGLGIGNCYDFTINTSLACEGYVTGQAHRVVARVDELLACQAGQDWDESSLVVSGDCNENTEDAQVSFKVRNKGQDMSKRRGTRVMAEDVVVFMAPIDLGGGQDTTIIIKEVMGETYRIVAEQSEGHPGNSFPTAVVEGCGTNEDGGFSTGFVSMFPEDDADPFISIDVQENTEAAVGTFLKAMPKGYRAERYIEEGRDIVYHIQFQNMTNETLRHIVIRDTLPEGLDITQVQPEASSHPYDFEIYGDRILRFTFDKLDIPSINEDEAHSRGFLKFRVKQMPNLPKGTIIENSVSVAQNLGKRVSTNTVKHTIGGTLDDFVEISLISSTDKFETDGVSIVAQPNPFTDYTILKIKGWEARNTRFILFDATGKQLHQASFDNNQLLFRNENLSKGIYFFRVEAPNGQLLDAGKLVVE